MDTKANAELNYIKSELQSIIDELYSISSGVRQDFTGIGNDKCADTLSAVAAHYKKVKKKLDNMDLITVTEEFAEKKRAEEKAKELSKAKAEAEAVAREKAEAEVKTKKLAEEVKAEIEAKVKKQNQTDDKSNNKGKKKSDSLLEDVFKWLFK